MTTKKRRMMLALPQELEFAFDEFREATGTAPASFVVQLLMESLPVIHAVTEAAIAAKDDRQKAMDIMHRAMNSALHQATGAQLDLYTPPVKRLRKAPGHKI